MKADMRRELARQPFEEKVRKVGQLLHLSAKMKPKADPLIISAIRRKSVLQFNYNGKMRIVEPQTYGLSTTGREVLRAWERPGSNGFKGSGMAKLFDLEKISGLRETGQTFPGALPAHNPDDAAMKEVFATLSKP